MEMDENIFDDKELSMPLLTSESNMQESFKAVESNMDIVSSAISFSMDLPNVKSVKKPKSHEINYRKQSFSKRWHNIPEFKDWLTESFTPDKAHCCYCKMDLTAGKSELLRHSKSRRHLKKSEERNAFVNFDEPQIDHLDLQLEANQDDEIILRSAVVTRIIDYRSDSLSHPNSDMRKEIIKSSTDQIDKRMDELESSVATLLNKEAGLFFPTHIMANLVAVMTHCWISGSAVVFGDKSDIKLNNQEALVKFSRLHCCQLENLLNGCFSLDELEELLKSLEKGTFHQNLICIESSHAFLGGVVPPPDWIVQVSQICKNYNAFLHCDGTRLANASIYCQKPLGYMVKGCDSVTFGLDKSLGAPLGAVLVGNETFISRCKLLRNSLGGHIHQPGPFAAAGKYALDSLPFIVDEHQKASSISLAIKRERSKQIAVDSCSLQTNVIHIKCISDEISAGELHKRLLQVTEEYDDVEIISQIVNENTVALWIHKDISSQDLKDTNDKLRRIIQELKETFSKSSRPTSERRKMSP